MGLSVGGNWWDRLGTSIGDSMIGMADPYGSLNPNDAMARQNAIRSSVGSIGAGMLANSRQRPMEAFGSAFQSAQQQGQQAGLNALQAKQMMLGMDKTRKDMAWESGERQAKLEAEQAEQERKKAMTDFVEQALRQPRSDIPMQAYGNARFWMAAGDPEKAYEALTGNSDDGAEYGTTAIYGKDAQGNTVLGQMKKSGGFKQAQLPPGFKLTPGVEKIDLGTSWGILNRDGDIVGTVPKDLAGAESERERGQMEGRQAAAAPGDVAAADMALGIIDDLKNDKRRVVGTGWSAILGAIPGTDAQAYQSKVNQAAAGSFLTAIQQMRGLGQLSNQEGLKVELALQRMTANIYNEKAFMEALEEYEEVVRAARNRAAGRIGASLLPDQTEDEGGWTTLPNGVRIRQKGP